MSVYFEKKISTTFGDICSNITWYKDVKLAIASYSQEKGGYLKLYKPAVSFDCISSYNNHFKNAKNFVYLLFQSGDIILTNIQNSKAVSCVGWHPTGFLFVAWDFGSLCFWFEDTNEIFNVESPHQATINLLTFSPKGNRLISADIVININI